MATIKELFIKHLPADVAERAIANCKSEHDLADLNSKFKSIGFDGLETPLTHCFVWEESVEGWDYWNGIDELYFQGKELIHD